MKKPTLTPMATLSAALLLSPAAWAQKNAPFTVTANMAGVPGISVPAGLSSEGTPLGLQLIGKPFDEATLFQVAQVIEDAAGRLQAPERWWDARLMGHKSPGTAASAAGKSGDET